MFAFLIAAGAMFLAVAVSAAITKGRKRSCKGSHVIFRKDSCTVVVSNHRGDLKKGGAMQHYYVIAERGDGRTWWLSFPDRTGVYSAAFDPGDIQAQVRDALDTAVDAGMALPRSIEDGAMPPANLSEFEEPTIVLVVPYEPSAETKAAAYGNGLIQSQRAGQAMPTEVEREGGPQSENPSVTPS